MSFDSFGLSAPILEAVVAKGFENPTPVQTQTVPLLLTDNTDLIALAGTGTGKTAAFGLPLLQKLDPTLKEVQAVILCPTRELCLQITNEIQSFAVNMPKTWILAVYGGSSIRDQIFALRKGVQIIVATPGRLMDLMDRNEANISHIRTVVLDEADEMLDMGFKEDIDKILSDTPKDKNVWLFSATFPKDVERIARTYMNDPVEVTIGSKNEAQKTIEHFGFLIHERDRYNALKRLLDFYPDIYGIIFCRTRMETQQVAEKLIKDGYPSASLHGDLSQGQRDQVMRSFREKSITILVATDVAARGIDVDSVSHVIHYNLPDDIESYTHRSGRTGRAGKQGISIALVNTREKGRIYLIERQTGLRLQLETIPSSEAICEKQLFAMINKMANVTVNEKEIEPFMTSVYEQLAEMSKEELIKRFVSIEFNRFLEYYRNARPLENVAERNRRGREDDRTSRPERSDRSNRGGDRAARGPRSDRPERRDRPVGPEAGMSTFVVEGVNRDLRKGALVRVICESANIGSESIGQIAFVKGMALIDVKEGVSESVSKLDAIKLDGKNLNVRSFVRGSFSDASSGSAPRSSGSGYRSGGGSYDRDRGSDRDRSRGGRSGGSSGDRERRRR
ncbi:MAG: DEAD/DEAH box helicase [Bacteroidetes bacterium]|nr:DEAD/DEAH box helicase [Bacteroidota bacterium]NCQ11173.1 DEAD/DEAH box helicase [Bacteroidota bacterium]